MMTELTRGDSAMSKAFSHRRKWSQWIGRSVRPNSNSDFSRHLSQDEAYLWGSVTTEPNSGSDNRLPLGEPQSGVRLRAERRGGEWILNGEKVFIANGGIAKLFFVRARTDSSVDARNGSALLLIPANMPGFLFGEVFNKRGWRFY